MALAVPCTLHGRFPYLRYRQVPVDTYIRQQMCKDSRVPVWSAGSTSSRSVSHLDLCVVLLDPLRPKLVVVVGIEEVVQWLAVLIDLPGLLQHVDQVIRDGGVVHLHAVRWWGAGEGTPGQGVSAGDARRS